MKLRKALRDLQIGDSMNVRLAVISETTSRMAATRETVLRATRAVLIVAGLASIAGCSSQQEEIGDHSANATSGTQQAKLTIVTPAMMVGRESFPSNASGNWQAPYLVDEPSGGGSDLGCAPLTERWERVGDSHVLASLDANAESRSLRYRVDLILPKNQDHPNIATIVEACPTLEQNGNTVQIRKESVAGIPLWATAFTVSSLVADRPSSASVIEGQYRGIDIDVAASRNNSSLAAADMGVLATMFNDQVAKLEFKP
ncbi:hypothetical protein FK535_06910 [Mycolicibacterium sp. 018/SC-01/001]|uniref:hypothetical protein n=1 Tax=Mycolicibacterium sp. 018/SC-01/001 TaxID=2592069 RepID=UPI001180EEF1|nr:hypothetical protein [Mycolicibacterium sp. 018/SC-01/001]TRW86198.1 hypothetical protein FK535_06910 [Mycolicibacterium sp. 018/SC-01/001]